MAGKPSQDQWDKAAEDGSLVITEGARRRADLGREAFRKIGRVLAVDRLAEEALQHEPDGDPREVSGQQIERGDKDCDRRGDDHRPATAEAIREPTPETLREK